MNNIKNSLSEEYIYYRTIPILKNWNMRKEYVPDDDEYFDEDGNHFEYEDFIIKYNSNNKFRKFIDEQHFRRIIEDYFIRNATVNVFPKFPYRYGSGTYKIEVKWNYSLVPFYLRTNYISVD